MTPTGGARLSVAAGGEGRDGLGRRKRKGNGPAMGFWAAGRKKEKEGWPTWAENEFSYFFLFCKRFKQIQVEFKFEEFKFKLNHNIKTMQG